MTHRFHISVDGAAFELEVREDDEGLIVVHADGRQQRVRPLSRLASPSQKLEIDGESDRFLHRRTADGHELVIDGAAVLAQVRDARSVQYSKMVKPPAALSRAEVKAPMPGLAVTVLVKVGDSVEKGQTLVTLNAMKLENDIRSPIAGVVQDVRITPGQTVEKGMLMVVVA